jgi:hypothetical protein
MSYKVELNSCDVLPRICSVESGSPVESDIDNDIPLAVIPEAVPVGRDVYFYVYKCKIEIIHTIYGMCSSGEKNEQE